MNGIHRETINALLPEGKFWEVKPESGLDKLYDGCASNADGIMDNMEKLAHLRDPYTTVMLDDLEREYGLVPITDATDNERRERLAAFKYRRNSTGAYDVLQQKLRDAGFTDVYVYPNSPITDPNEFLARAFNMTCGDILPAGNEAQCGEPEAICASVGGELVVNGDLTTSIPMYNVQCDDGITCGDGSCSGDFSGYRSTGKDAEYSVPIDSQYWPFVFYVGSNIVINNGDGVQKTTITNQLTSVIYGLDKYVAVGNSGKIMTSTNGINWTERTSGTTENLWSVAYGNNMFIAVGSEGVILKSTDGITWTTISSTPGKFFFSICFDGSKFIIACTPNTIYSSTDGISWSSHSTGSTYDLYGIIFGNGIYVAVGYNGTILTSTDLTTWTARTSGTTQTLYGITYGNGKYITVGANGTIIASTNASTWSLKTSGTTKTLKSVAYGNSSYIAVGGTGTILKSSDTNTWTTITSGTIYLFTGITYASKFVLCGYYTVALIDTTKTIESIGFYRVPTARRLDFRRIILRFKPLFSWGALIVEYN